MPSLQAVKGVQRSLPVSVGFQVPSAQNTPDAKVAYFRVAWPDPHSKSLSRAF